MKKSKVNPSYDQGLKDYYNDFIETYERVLKIDENNEREKFLADVSEDITGFDSLKKMIK